MLLKSKESKVVFVALTQHCIQSNATHVERVKSVHAMLEECGPVEFLWHWYVQSLTKLAHTSK